MDDRRNDEPRLLAPGGGQGDLRLPGAAERLPAVDDRLAPPETRIEYLHGEKLYAAPADEPHAAQHNLLAYVLGAHVAPGYTSAVDMLTRTAGKSDFAPDASLFPSARDPETGGRRLEELAFEVASQQALKVPTDKARELIRRGVRRVFCILVAQERVLEWSRQTDGWSPLADSAVIEDRCLVRPLPVRALLDAAAADDAAATALLDKHVPAIERALRDREVGARAEGRTEGRAEGRIEGHIELVLKQLERRFGPLPKEIENRVRAASSEQIDALAGGLLTAASLNELFGTR